jgi:arylsulfatase A-like enzyme
MVTPQPGQTLIAGSPPVPSAPTADEDLSTKPAAQIAFREAYYSGYGPAPAINRTYERNTQPYRLHAEVDGPIDRVRRTVTDGGSANAVLVRTADHGDLLRAHGGLHQKWFNLYDEATRVPFVIGRIGERATSPRKVTAPTSHVDPVPTLLAAAGIDVATTAATVAEALPRCTTCRAATSCPSSTAARPTTPARST